MYISNGTMDFHNNIIKIVESQGCTGCGMCKAICPIKAIQFKQNGMGNIYPSVNDNCIECGECLDVCPWNNNLPILDVEDKWVGQILRSLVGKSLNDSIYRNSQSGGVVTQILYMLFEEHSIDAAIVCKSQYGFPFPNNKAQIITSKESLSHTQGSIYTPIDVLSILDDIGEYSSVALVALPCQVESIRTAQAKGLFLNVKYVIGLICDRILGQELNTVLCAGAEQKVPYRIEYRAKKYGYKHSPIVIHMADKDSIFINPVKRHALKDFYTHPRCYACFDKLNIYADIVCGDPWNIQSDVIDWNNGASLIIVRTQLGDSIVNRLLQSDYIATQEIPKEVVVEAQGVEFRKKRCIAAIGKYQKKNWSYPYWLCQIANGETTNEKTDFVEKCIDDYLKHEAMSVNDRLEEALLIVNKKEKEVQNHNALHKRICRKLLKLLKL